MTKHRLDDAESGRDRPVQITPAMIEAGVYAAREHPLGAPLEDLVRVVFIAMRVESNT